MWSNVPRRSLHSSITAPTYSLGTMIDAFTNGSSTSSTSRGNSAGLCTSSHSPSRSLSRYATVGAVTIRSRSNSRSRRRSRLLDLLDLARKLRRVVHLEPLPVAFLDAVRNGRRGDDQVEVELALEAPISAPRPPRPRAETPPGCAPRATPRRVP